MKTYREIVGEPMHCSLSDKIVDWGDPVEVTKTKATVFVKDTGEVYTKVFLTGYSDFVTDSDYRARYYFDIKDMIETDEGPTIPRCNISKVEFETKMVKKVQKQLRYRGIKSWNKDDVSFILWMTLLTSPFWGLALLLVGIGCLEFALKHGWIAK